MHKPDEVQIYSKDTGLLMWSVDVRCGQFVAQTAWTIHKNRSHIYAVASGDRIAYWSLGLNGEPHMHHVHDPIEENENPATTITSNQDDLKAKGNANHDGLVLPGARPSAVSIHV